jgi:hypothetical protein
MATTARPACRVDPFHFVLQSVLLGLLTRLILLMYSATYRVHYKFISLNSPPVWLVACLIPPTLTAARCSYARRSQPASRSLVRPRIESIARISIFDIPILSRGERRDISDKSRRARTEFTERERERERELAAPLRLSLPSR